METVNIVATGAFNFDELDIEQLHHDLGESVSRIQPGRLDVKLDDETPLVLVYPAGTYTIPGARSLEELQRVRAEFIDCIERVTDGALSEHSFSIKYMVFLTDIDQTIDLETLALDLGLERVEYEPEQFPGLIYRAQDPEGVVLIFASGKLLFTGFDDEADAKTLETDLRERLVTE